MYSNTKETYYYSDEYSESDDECECEAHNCTIEGKYHTVNGNFCHIHLYKLIYDYSDYKKNFDKVIKQINRTIR